MSNAIIETALDTGEKIQARAPNSQNVAPILLTPPSLESSATAGMIISLGMALSPPRTWKGKSLAHNRLRRTALSTHQPRPLLHMAADLLNAIDTRGHNCIASSLQRQADICREQIEESAAALEQLNPLRNQNSAYYSSDAAATLMAHLAVPEELDWTDPATLTNLSMADYACGHGALLTAAYQRARELHSLAGGDPAPLHSHMMEQCITATDISPTALAMTVEHLTRIQPDQPVGRTRTARLPNSHDPAEGEQPRHGALDLLIHDQLPPGSIPLPPDAYKPGTQQLVLINPPFGRLQDQKNSMRRFATPTGAARPAGPAQVMARLALGRRCHSRRFLEQMLSPPVRHTQEVWPQVQQMAMLFISSHCLTRGSYHPRHALDRPAKPQYGPKSRFAGSTMARSTRKTRTVEVVLQALQQLGNLIGVVHVGFPLADHTVFVDDNRGPFPV